MDTVEYAPGRNADLIGSFTQRTVLMWHGAQSNARATMRPLAERVAGNGYGVVVADWDSHADDRGRDDLLASLRYAREVSTSPDAMVLVGWSMGGVAAAGVTLRAEQLGVKVAHTVCLAGAFMVADPVIGEPLPSDLSGVRERAPFTLLHGVDDDVIPPRVSHDFAVTLRRNGWPVEVFEMGADHGSIAGASYDAAADRYSPADNPDTLAVVTEIAARIVDAAQ